MGVKGKMALPAGADNGASMAKFEITTEDFKKVEIEADSCQISFPYVMFNRFGEISEGFRQPRHFKLIHDMEVPPPPATREVPGVAPSVVGGYDAWRAGLPKK